MKILGIIAEYNPFHNGHLYHLQTAKEKTKADAVVVVMSGSFVQRGEPAFADKWTRAEIAIKNGVDLVLELPFAFACNNAEFFARGGVAMLDRLGCVDAIAFGSEMEDPEPLRTAAKLTAEESESFRDIMRQKLDAGMPYPKAATQTLSELSGISEDALSGPNNLLSVQYIKQLIQSGSEMQIVTVPRDGITSASNVRAAIREGRSVHDMVPSHTIEVLQTLNCRVNLEINDLHDQIYTSLLRTSKESLAEIFAAGEGLENRLLDRLRGAADPDALIAAVKGKRYTTARIKRLLIQQLIGLTKRDFAEITQERLLYGRVLALSQTGADLLRYIKSKECCDYPLITNVNKEYTDLGRAELLLRQDILAADLYNLTAGHDLYRNSDFVRRLFVQRT